MTKTIPQLDPATTLPADPASLMEISIPGGGSRKLALADIPIVAELIQPVNALVSNGTDLTVSGGNSDGGNGGRLYLQGGNSSVGDGGTINIVSGQPVAGGFGGDINLNSNNAGSVSFTAGAAKAGGPGGLTAMFGGVSHISGSNGGAAEIHGGVATVGNANGGAVSLSPGTGVGTGHDGSIIFPLSLVSAADDAGAAAGNVPVNGLYRTGSAVKLRIGSSGGGSPPASTIPVNSDPNYSGTDVQAVLSELAATDVTLQGDVTTLTGEVATLAAEITALPISVSKSLTSADILALHDTPFELIPAPAANQYISIISISGLYIHGTIDYTGGGDFIFGYGLFTEGTYWMPTSDGIFLGTDSQYIAPQRHLGVVVLANIVNQDFVLAVSGALLDGDGTARFDILYEILDLPV